MSKIKLGIVILVFAVACMATLRFVLADDGEIETETEKPVVTKSTNKNSSSSSSGSTKTDTKVTTDVVTRTIVQKDSDGDGLLDNNDPHPNIPELYIVTDENKNGIVDQFEK